MALHRARDVAQHDERARLADLAPPDPRDELAARPEVAPEHRPRREPPAVRMELVAARPAALEPGHEEVDQALGLAQLGRRHPVELAMAQDLALRIGIGRDDDALDRGLVVALAPVGGDRDAVLIGRHLATFLARLGRAPARDVGLVRARVVARQRRGREVAREPARRDGATSGRRPRRRRRGRHAGGRRSRRRPRGPARDRRCRPGSGPGRSRPRRRGRSRAAPRAATARTRPPR